LKQSFDVLVAGGGPAGSAAALDLARRGISVALIEQDRYEAPRVGETLPPFIRSQLVTLGIWERFLDSQPLESYGMRTAWDTAEPRQREFLTNPYGCGWHVDRARFDALLASAAVDAGAELITGRAGACGRESDDFSWLQVTSDKSSFTLTGRVLVDATGRKALVAGRLGAQADVADRLIGAVVFTDASPGAQCTQLEAVETGWWYSAPLPQGRMVFAFMTDADLWREADWTDLLRNAPLTAERAKNGELPPPAEIVSAASMVRRPSAGPGWVAVGDAAFAYDPLSGQGVSKSIDCGLRAADCIARHLKEGSDRELSDGFAAYDAWVQKTYASYLSMRLRFYGSVRRWPASRFWMRRAGP
jgi:flavin-dependent dehydrogenase